jgi:Tetratricopeptide repeat
MAERQNRRGWAVRAAVGAALILAGFGAGVAGASQASTSWLVRAAGAAVGAVAGLVAAIWVDRADQRREARMTALRVRDGALDVLRTDPPNKGSVFDVLLATSTEAAPFRGRKDDLAWLNRWWDNPNQQIAVVSGPAGTGKTRLVTQFALDRPAPWVSGWLSGDRGADAVAAIRACSDPVLVLVDDADQRPDVAALLASLTANRGAGTPVRVILISRGTGLGLRLAATLDDRSRGMLDGVGELPLGPFGCSDDRARWFTEAVRSYARARQVPPPDLPARLSSPIADPAEPILTLHAQALLAVLDSEGSRPLRPHAEGLPFDRVSAALFAHEQHRWEVSAQRPEFGLTDLTRPVQAQAIAVLLLARPVDQAQAVAALTRVPELATASDERRANIARWAAHLYPSDPPWPIQIKPDMLAEWFAVTQLAHTPSLMGLLRAMTSAQKAALLLLLAHASDHVPQAVQLFADMVAANIRHLAEVAAAAALTASAGQWRLDGELAYLIRQTDWPADDLRRVGDQLAGRLPQTYAAVAEAWVKIARTDGDSADLPKALTDLGNVLAKLGRHQEALAATEESVGLWRPLARDNPAHQPDLARALDDFGNRLGDLGRHQMALAAGEESVGLWRPFAGDNSAHQPGLARALANLGSRLRDLGRHQEALAATEESVGLWRPLARDNPAHQPDLARALANLAVRLGDRGRHQEALAAGEESVGLWRPLARDNPAHQPGLAWALGNLAVRLRDLGRHQEALAAGEESAGLWRPLARDNPAHQPELARALPNLAAVMGELGRYQEALVAFKESVGLWRPLARDNPAYEPDLARALANLGSDLSYLGRHQEALAATEESVGLWRPLARDNPAYEPGLALALANLGSDLSYLGRHQEALAATEESVGLWRPLARDNPAHQPGLAWALGNLAVRLGPLGRHQEALAATEEAVELWKALARSNPGRYQETYNRTLAQLRRNLDLHGKESASILLHLDGDSSNRDTQRRISPVRNLPEE